MGDKKNQINATQAFNSIGDGGVNFQVGEPDSGYKVNIGTMPRDEITNLALLTFARMDLKAILNAPNQEKQQELIAFEVDKIQRGLRKPPKKRVQLGQDGVREYVKGTAPNQDVVPFTLTKAAQIAQRVQSTFLKKAELAESIQFSIRNPRSGQQAWDLASQVGDPTGKPSTETLKAQTFPAGDTKEAIQAQLDYVKHVSASNLVTDLGITGLGRNDKVQTIKDPQGNTLFQLYRLGTPDNNSKKAAMQVMQSYPPKTHWVSLLAESDTSVSRFSNFMKLLGLTRIHKVTSDESNTGNILDAIAEEKGKNSFDKSNTGNTLDAGAKRNEVDSFRSSSVSAYTSSHYAKGTKRLKDMVAKNQSLMDQSRQSAEYITNLDGGLDTIVEGEEEKEDLVERYDNALDKVGEPNDDNRSLVIALAAYSESKITDEPIAMFCKSGKDRTGALVNMVTAIAMLDHQLGEKDLDLSEQANIKKLADNYREIHQSGVNNFISGLNSEGAGVLNGIELLPKAFKEYYEGEPEGQKFLAELEVAHALGKQNKGWDGDQLEKLKLKKLEKKDSLEIAGIYEKGIAALKTIKANYETRDVQVAALAALQGIEEKEGPISKFFTDIGTAIGLGGKPISPKDKAIARLEKEMNKSKLLFGLIPISSHYSDAQKELMKQIIYCVDKKLIGINGNPADLLKNIQESKAKYDLDVVQQDALTVIQEVLSKQKTEAEILSVQEIGRDSDFERESLISLTPKQAVIEKLKKIQSHYSSEQKALMQGVIEALGKTITLDEGTMTLDGNTTDKEILREQISKAVKGASKEVGGDPIPMMDRRYDEKPQEHTNASIGVYESLSKTGTNLNEKDSGLLKLAKEMDHKAGDAENRIRGLTNFDNKENKKPNKNSEEKHTSTRFDGHH